MPYLRKLKFTTHDGRKIQFDVNGDLEIGHYDILNWQIDNTGGIAFVKIGEYKFQESSFELVLPKNSTLYWNTESSRVSWSAIFFIHIEREIFFQILSKCKTPNFFVIFQINFLSAAYVFPCCCMFT